MNRLKAYTVNHGLVVSKPIKDENHIIEALEELSNIDEIKKVYMTNGKTSYEIKFITKDKSTRPIYYTRSDNTQVQTLSIHPKYYPMIAHFADGTKEVISL